ncbi:tripartite tricarboxylate transporter TctB family protein [Actinophytocola gossypii]|uniref:Tripartite tricarboxylate transporter TctB family protein n=1 Tax=Actinophytocola gossypii TaxID=2812003 RepID=A0ABT2J9E0_9PSEU|nr:tripartite tricarboxylate transporter TctB family protein [Actinophytocola gossypii]MCT2584480.1 hypothetical protein [Actinophytocola gossypii]
MTTKSRPTSAAWTPMLVLLLLAALAVEEGLRLLLTVDPAAQADMAGWYVLALGLVLAVTTLYAERPGRAVSTSEESEEEGVVRPATPRRDMVLCLAFFAGYAVLLGTAGHVVAGCASVLGYLRFVSRYPWVRAIAYTAAVNAVLVTLFELSGVVLPTGLLGF